MNPQLDLLDFFEEPAPPKNPFDQFITQTNTTQAFDPFANFETKNVAQDWSWDAVSFKNSNSQQSSDKAVIKILYDGLTHIIGYSKSDTTENIAMAIEEACSALVNGAPNTLYHEKSGQCIQPSQCVSGERYVLKKNLVIKPDFDKEQGLKTDR